MRVGLAVGILAILATLAVVRGQSPAPPPAFEVVSVRPSIATGRGSFRPLELPNGDIRFTGAPVIYLLQRAYPTIVGAEIVVCPSGRDATATT